MPVILTDNGARLSSILKHEYEPSTGFTREVVTVNLATAATLKLGTVLGVVTATGKYKPSVAGATDGSQNAIGIYIGDVLGNAADVAVAATTDTKVLILRRGPAIIAAESLVWDASYDTQAEKDAALIALAALGIVASPLR